MLDLNLFSRIQKTLEEKFKLFDNVIYTKNDIFIKSIKQHVSEIFLDKWINYPDQDPIDILDNMILLYFLYEKNAELNNQIKLLIVYSTYIRTLIFIKNLIKKETI